MSADNSPGAFDKWGLFQFFLGAWHGIASGKAGDGTAERTYALILQNQFLEVRNRSIYPPQAANPKGEVHEDLGLIGYDQGRSLYVMREFHVEGYVNQYALEPPTNDGQTLVFVTEALENMPPGWQARTTLEILSPDSFRETFDLARPDQAWACFITNEFTRARNG